MPRVFYIPRWSRPQRTETPAVMRVVDVAFGPEVSIRSSDYITEVHLRTYGLASIDDDEEIGSTLAMSTSIVVAAPKPMDKTTAALASTLAEIAPIPRGNAPRIWGFVYELYYYCFNLTSCTLP